MNYSLSDDGFEIVESVLTPAQAELLREAVAGCQSDIGAAQGTY